jgi:hypothetical protein
MAVNVDHPRRDILSAAVDDHRTRGRSDARLDRLDHAVSNQHVAAIQPVPVAVEHRRTTD